MTHLLIEARGRIASLYSSRHSIPSIVERLEQEQVKCAIYHLVKKFHLKGVVKDLPKRKKARILWTHGYIICTTIPRFHAWMVNYTRRVCSMPRKPWSTQICNRDALLFSRGTTRDHEWKNEVIIEWYRRYSLEFLTLLNEDDNDSLIYHYAHPLHECGIQTVWSCEIICSSNILRVT